MNKATFAGFFILVIAALPASAAVINIGTQYLEPNEAGQTFQVFVSSPAQTAVLMSLDLQVGDGGPDFGGTLGPAISNADVLTGTVFGAQPNAGDEGWSASNPGVYPQVWRSMVLTENSVDPMDPLAPEADLNGLIATVTVDTTGFGSGTWNLIGSESVTEDRTEFYTVVVVPADPPEHPVDELMEVLVPLTVNDGSIVLVDTTLNTVADGSWGNGATWDLATPFEGYKTAVGNNTVSVDADAVAFALVINNAGGNVTVESDQTLSTLRDIDVVSGTLELASRGTASVGKELAVGASGVFAVEVAGADNGLAAASDVDLKAGSTLELEATAALNNLSPQGWADQTRTIITGNVSGFFDNEPAGHIGRGVFVTDGGANSQAVTYKAGNVEVDLLQAAPGDTDGNRKVEGSDILNILQAGLFGDGVTPQANWGNGDFNSDSKISGEDILALLGTGLFGDGTYTSSSKSARANIQADAQLVVSADGVILDSNGATINGYVLTSEAGILTGEAANNLGSFQTDSDVEISGTFGFELDGELELGDVLGDAIGDVDLLGDLSLVYTIEGASGIFTAAVVVPEPATIAMLLGALALLPLVWRRRKLNQ